MNLKCIKRIQLVSWERKFFLLCKIDMFSKRVLIYSLSSKTKCVFCWSDSSWNMLFGSGHDMYPGTWTEGGHLDESNWDVFSQDRLKEFNSGRKGFKETAAAAAKSLQSCPTLWDPTDGSSPGSPVPGILQARTLEWVAISFSNVWKWKVKMKSLIHVRLFATPWTAAYQTPLSMGFARQEYWSGVPLPSPKETV